MHCNYTGKLADTFEYPYTIELTFNISSHSSASCYMKDDWFDNNIGTLNPKLQTGKFIFSDASTCSASFYTIYRYHQGSGSVNWEKKDFNLTKQ